MRRLSGLVLALLTAALMVAPAAQAGIPPVRGTLYGPLPTEIVTIYLPNTPLLLSRGTPSGLPQAVLLVHGGGWHQQHNETEQPTIAQGLRGQGFVVFDVDYPQANLNEAAFPREPDAIERAVRWVHANGASFGADPENIVLLGGSAGGNLVSLVGERGLPGVRGVAELSGPTNLATLVEMGIGEELKASLAFSLSIALGCAGEGAGWEKILACDGSPAAAEWSPVNHVPSKASCPNWFLGSGEEDLVPLSQQLEFLPKLRAAGCNATLEVVPGKGHGFGLWSRIGQAVYSFIAAN
jgi:acetyl esterase/lipase